MRVHGDGFFEWKKTVFRKAHIPAPVHLLFHFSGNHSGEAHKDRLIAFIILAGNLLKKVTEDLLLLGIKNPQVMNAVQSDEALFHIMHFILGLVFRLDGPGEVIVGEVFSLTQQPPDQPTGIRLQQTSHPGSRLPQVQPVLLPQFEIEQEFPLLCRSHLQDRESILLTDLLDQPVKIDMGHVPNEFFRVFESQNAVQRHAARQGENLPGRFRYSFHEPFLARWGLSLFLSQPCPLPV